jgi:hypothetical protein
MYKKFFVSYLKERNYIYSMYLSTVKVGSEAWRQLEVLQGGVGAFRGPTHMAFEIVVTAVE